MKRGVLSCILLAAAVFAGTTAFAKIVLTPGVELREEYNDNIFLENSDEEHDYITTVTPSIKLEYSADTRLDVSLDYRLDYRFYSRHSEYNDTGLRDSQSIVFLGKAVPLRYLHIEVSDTYGRVPVDIRDRSAAGNQIVNMTESNTFYVSPYLMLPLSSTLTAKAGYKYGNAWYRDENNTDYENHSVFVVMDKKLSAKVSGGVKYEYYSFVTGQEDITGDVEDYDSNRGSVLLSYKITPDFLISGEAGRSWIDYDSGDNETVDFWNLSADYKFRITESTTLGAGYSASLQDSPRSGASKQRRADIFFRAGRILVLSVNPYYFVDKYIRADREDRVRGIAATVSRPLTKKMNLSLDGDWEKQNFRGDTDEDVNRYSAGAGLDYRVTQKITAALNYRYNKLNSTQDEDDFTNNIVWLLAKIVF